MRKYMTLDQQTREVYKEEGRQEALQKFMLLLEENKDKTVDEIL